VAVKLPKINFDEHGPATASSEHKPFWTRVLTSTPVVMTVLATILAGLSTSEMTLAQYRRSLAAQNQSKAGDQWNLFQDKRIRGSNVEMHLDLLHSLTNIDGLEPTAFSTAGTHWTDQLRNAQKEVNRLLAAGSAGSAGEPLRQAATEFKQFVSTQLTELEQSGAGINEELSKPDTRKAFGFLQTKDLPSAPIQPIDDPAVRSALQAIQARQPEEETIALVAQTSEPAIHHAIQIAESNIDATEKANKPISKTLDRLDQWLQGRLDAARSLQHGTAVLQTALAGLPASDRTASLRDAVAHLAGTATALKNSSAELRNNFRAAQHGYTARRYEREARCNEQAAVVYELQVRKNSALAERHRGRSKNFFYGMLVAQAGVTISTFALAVKHHSLLWSLAGLAGLTALLLGAYVYFYM
jgi:hypothetical protein